MLRYRSKRFLGCNVSTLRETSILSNKCQRKLALLGCLSQTGSKKRCAMTKRHRFSGNMNVTFYLPLKSQLVIVKTNLSLHNESTSLSSREKQFLVRFCYDLCKHIENAVFSIRQKRHSHRMCRHILVSCVPLLFVILSSICKILLSECIYIQYIYIYIYIYIYFFSVPHI